MGRLLLLAVALIAFSGYVLAQTEVGIGIMTPTQNGGNPTVTGFVKFTTINATHTSVHVKIDGITSNPDGTHGIHVHKFGDISDPSGLAMGPHWDPEGHDHSCEPNVPRAAGDMGNWQANGGSIDETKEITLLALSGPNSIIGRGVVLHNTTDDCAVVASSGPRIAVAAIGVANVAGNTAAPAPTYNGAAVLAVCVLKGCTDRPETTGTFSWSQPADDDEEVDIVGWINWTGTHGVHIHAFGDLTLANGTSTGGHWDPKATGIHALPDNTSVAHHAGDMGNTDPVYVVEGKLWYNAAFGTEYMAVDGKSATPNLGILGRGFIVHVGTDDGVTQPTGNAGARAAQCVVGIANSTLTKVALVAPAYPSPAPVNGADTLIISFTILAATLLMAFTL